MIEDPNTPLVTGPIACPFLAFEDDRDHRSGAPDYRHRCFAAAEPEPRAFPHQERYCLTAEFARCPVFLEWARQEAAGIRGSEAGAASMAATIAETRVEPVADEDTPAFLAGRSRTTVAAGAGIGSERTTEAGSLWNYDTESVKAPSSKAAPVAPSSLGQPAIAMARRGPSHPGWENPPRLETFPRLRSRDDRRANQPLLIAAVAVSILMVALVAFPILMNQRGGGGAQGTPSAQASTSASPSSAVPSPTAQFTYIQYTVQSGDYLAKIAAKFNLHLWEIQIANPQIADFNHIEVGQVINIPPAGLLTQPPATAAPTAS